MNTVTTNRLDIPPLCTYRERPPEPPQQRFFDLRRDVARHYARDPAQLADLQLSSQFQELLTGSTCSPEIRDAAVKLATEHDISFKKALEHIERQVL